jgi:hypothetical protein
MGGIVRLLICACSVVVFGTAVYVVAAKADPEHRVAVPGTGVTMTLPEGVVLPPFGTFLYDNAREVVVVVTAASASRDQTQDPLMRALYPDPVESFRSSTLEGNLYRRTRAEDGGGYDGWWLVVHKDDQILDVKISYSGSKPGEFLRLKQYLSTVSWDGRLADPEVAFGLKLNVPGMQLVRAGFGALSYSSDGQPNENEPYLLATVIPGRLMGDISNFRRVCEAGKSISAQGKSFSQIRYQTSNRMTVCDAWSLNPTLTGQDYFAALMLPDASIVQVAGHGEPEVFQRSLLGAYVIPRRN